MFLTHHNVNFACSRFRTKYGSITLNILLKLSCDLQLITLAGCILIALL